MSRKVKIWVLVFALSPTLFLIGPFLLLPAMLSSKPVTANELSVSDVFNVVYTPFMKSLSHENPYMRVWLQYSKYQCSEHEGACANVVE